jgi:hypothetical protein
MAACAQLAIACAAAETAPGAPDPGQADRQLPAYLFEGPLRTGEETAICCQGEAFAGGPMLTVTAGTASRQEMSGFGTAWSGNAQLFWAAPGTGAELTLGLPVLTLARYRVVAYMTRAPDYGRIEFSLDGQPTGVSFDGYGAEVAPADPVILGLFALDTGTRTLSLRVVGRHPESAGFFVGLDRVVLVPIRGPGW